MRIVNYSHLDVSILSYSVVFVKSINLLRLRYWCFPGKFMNFWEEAVGGIWKKLFLKTSQYSQESCRTATLLKWDCNTKEAVAQTCSVKKVFLKISQNSQENTCARVSFLIKLQARLSSEHCEIFKNTYFEEYLLRTLVSSCFCIGSFIKFR